MKKFLCVVLVLILSFSLMSCDKIENEDIAYSTETKSETKKSTKSKEDVEAIYDDKFANSQGIYVTEKYIYSINNFNVTRYNKTTFSSEQITDSSSDAVCVTKDSVYYVETDATAPKLYKLADDEETPEYLYDLSNEEYFFIDGKYIYSVSQNGSVIRHIHSAEKYAESEEILYSGMANAKNVRYYNGYIYYTANNQLVCISTDDGSSETIDLEGEFRSDGFGTTLSNSTIYFSNNKLIYADGNAELYSVNLDGIGIQKFSNIYANSYFIADEYIYVRDSGNCYKIEIDTNTVNTATFENKNMPMFGYCHTLSDTGKGIVYTNGSNKLILADYEGNQIGIITK